MGKESKLDVEREDEENLGDRYFNLVKKEAELESKYKEREIKREETRKKNEIDKRRGLVLGTVEKLVEDVENGNVSMGHLLELTIGNINKYNGKFKDVRGNVRNVVYDKSNPIEDGYVDLSRSWLLGFNKRVRFDSIFGYDLNPKRSDKIKREEEKRDNERKKEVERIRRLDCRTRNYVGGGMRLHIDRFGMVSGRQMSEVMENIARKNGWEYSSTSYRGSQTGYGEGNLSVRYLCNGENIVATVSNYPGLSGEVFGGEIDIGGPGAFSCSNVRKRDFPKIDNRDMRIFVSSLYETLSDKKGEE